MGGGAWPFLVGGAICLVNSDNERDSGLLVSATAFGVRQPLVTRFGGVAAWPDARRCDPEAS